MNGIRFNFTAALNQSIEIYKKNFLLLVGASLVASILTSVTVGILTGPIMAGLITLILKLMDKDSSAAFEDIFSRFDTFATTFLLCFVWGIALYIGMILLMVIPIIGQLVAILIGIGFSVFITFAIMLAAEKGMNFSQASRAAFDMLKKDFWPLIGFTALASVLSGVGAIACGIGVIFTMPIFYIMLASAYRNCSAQTPADEILLEPVAPPAEPTVTEPAQENPAEPEPPAEDPEPESSEEPDKQKPE
jgi:hypothetical protein